jgi:hypothetical protein
MKQFQQSIDTNMPSIPCGEEWQVFSKKLQAKSYQLLVAFSLLGLGLSTTYCQCVPPTSGSDPLQPYCPAKYCTV